MDVETKRLFVGIKINRALQEDLDSAAPEMKQYFDGNSHDYLEVVHLGEDKLIGRYIKDGFPAVDIGDVSRNVCSIIRLITRGRRIEDNDLQIYSC